MAYNDFQIAQGGNGSYSLELYEWIELPAPSPVIKSMIIKDEFLGIGKDNEPMATHLRGELQLQVLDEDNYFRDLFKNASPGQFYIVSRDGDVINYIGFLVPNFIGGQFWKKHNLRTFVFGDGITTLRAQENDYTSPIQLGDFFYQVLSDIGVSMPLNILFGYQHYQAFGQSGIKVQQIQITPSDFVHNIESPTKYDVLMAVLDHFKTLQIWQQNGEWYIAQRNLRSVSGAIWARCNSGNWSIFESDPLLSIQRSAFRSEDTQDLQFGGLNKIVRTVTIKEIPFETKNPDFSKWTGGTPDDWETDGNIFQIIGPPTGIRLLDDATTVSQLLPRVLAGDDTIRFQMNGLVTWIENQPSGSYNAGLAYVKRTSLLDNSIDYLRNDGTWSASPYLFTETEYPNNGPSQQSTFSFNVEASAAGNFFIHEIILFIAGDTNAISSIQFYNASLSPVSIDSQLNETKYIAKLDEFTGFDSITENAYVDDASRINFDPGIKFYDGSEWLKAEDWSSNGSNVSLHEIVLKDYLEQLSVINRGYRIQIPYNHNISLSKLANLPWFEGGKDFTIHRHLRYRRQKKQLIEICERSQGSATVEKQLQLIN